LGRPYSIHGSVVHGEGRGHALGVPTANLEVRTPDKLIPEAGIYAVRVVLRRGMWDGALHLGPRPTFPGSPPAIEVHILDFEGELYDEVIRVDFIRRLRGIESFPSTEALVVQMRKDIEQARRLLSVERGEA